MKDSNFNPWFHIMYWGIIVIMLGVFIILVSPNHVTAEAMGNISFASALVSIVLAVVSIVWSIISGHTSTNRQIAISSIESDISQRLVEFKKLETEIKDALTETGNKVDNVRSEIASITGSLYGSSSKKSEKDQNENSGVQLTRLPNFALYAMYAACSAYKKQRSIKLDDLDKLPDRMGNYFSGFWVALDRLHSSYFGYKLDSKEDRLSIIKYESSFWGDTDSILDAIKKSGSVEIVTLIDKMLSE